MSVFRGVFRFGGGAGPLAAGGACRISSLGAGTIPDLEPLQMACRGHADHRGWLPSATGLAASLVGRPGRRVDAWIATEPAGVGGGAAVLGIVTLVAVAGPPPRHSIAGLLVSPAARRRGVGRALVATALAAARDAGAAEVWVEAHDDWAGAVAFWQAIGFSRT